MAICSDENDGKTQLWRRAYLIFEAALERLPEEREQFVCQQAEKDPSLLPLVFELLKTASEEGLDQAELTGPDLLLGSTLGRYHITAKLGRGGMGHVYQAQDTELGRVVALKFLVGGSLPDQAGDAGRRLIHEARSASALNHPNIVTVYDVIRHGSDIALAMELVDGSSLREFCSSPQPLDRVTGWGKQIAQALAATHTHGIIHRDIKPENIMVRKDGYIKVLDFGLARRATIPGGASRSTLFGMLGGTLSYMSPEQTRGETPTAASDIFSLGTVLYELFCGQHPFLADSPIDTAYAIAHDEPARAEGVRPEIPIGVSSLLADMLTKDPARRPSAGEVEERFATGDRPPPSITDSRPENLASPVAVEGASPSSSGRTAFSQTRRVTLLLLTVAAASVLLYLGFRAFRREGSNPAVIRYSILMPAGYQARSVMISPQGDELLYVASGPTGSMLYRRFLDSGDARAVAGSEGAEAPFFSPDGQNVAFFLADRIRISSPTGQRDIAPIPKPGRAHGFWGSDDFIYFNGIETDVPGIWRVPSRGGKSELVLDSLPTTRGFTFRLCQQQLPGGLLFSTNAGPVSRSIQWFDASDRSMHRLIEHGMGGQVVPTGHLLYYSNGQLLAAPFDPHSHQLSGPTRAVLDGVRENGWIGPDAWVSTNGTLVYLKEFDLPSRTLGWVTPEDRETAIPLPPADYEQAEVSPDGSHLAMVRREEQSRWTVWTYETRSGGLTKLLDTTVQRPRVIWSPDSRSLVVGMAPDGGEFPNLFRVSVDAPARAERLTNQPDFGQFPMSWSKAANAILFLEGIHPHNGSDVQILHFGEDRPRVLASPTGSSHSPTFSPDGHWFAYSSDVSGQVYLQDVAQSGPLRQISGEGGGLNPLWSPNGDQIFFLQRTGALMSVSVDAAGNHGLPRQLISHRFTVLNDMWTRGYSMGPDGRFLVIHEVPTQHAPKSEIEVAVNWFSELKRLVPVP